jgi:membrane protein required for colicin V production
MIWIDYTLSGLVFVCIVLGLWRGFIRELFALGFWILASWISLNFSREFSLYLNSGITHPAARIIVSFVALFTITLSFGGLVGFLLSLVSKKNGLTFMDRFTGMMLGVVRGLVVITVVVILAGLTPLTKDSWWSESTMIPPFQSLAIWLRDHISSGVAEYIRYS